MHTENEQQYEFVNIDMDIQLAQNEEQEKTKPPIPISKPNRAKNNSDYLRLDIYGYKDYIYTMAGFECMSATRYIQQLIEKDMEQNASKYKTIKGLKSN